MTVFLLRLPAETFNQGPQDRFHTALAGVRNRLPAAAVDPDLFILGADAPLIARLPPGMKEFFQLFLFMNFVHRHVYSEHRAERSRPFR